MKINLTIWATCLMVSCLVTGCSTTHTQTIRGQSPESRYAGLEQTGFSNPQPLHAMKAEVHDMVYSHTAGNPYETTWHNGGNSYPTGNGYCPPNGYDSCPPTGHGGCPGGCRKGCIHHHHSYSVKQMQNPVYPDQNQPGGVVVYPYYTFKGPDCFFYKGD